MPRWKVSYVDGHNEDVVVSLGHVLDVEEAGHKLDDDPMGAGLRTVYLATVGVDGKVDWDGFRSWARTVEDLTEAANGSDPTRGAATGD